MHKKMILLLLITCTAFAANSMAQEPAELNKNILMKEISAPDSLAASATPAKAPSAIAAVDTAQASAVAPLAGADLRPALWVDCYTGDFEDVLARRGFLFVRNIYVYVYNSGTRASSDASGKIEFFDVLTDRNVVSEFNVDPTESKKWGNIRPRNSVAGPFIVKKDTGITASVTFLPTSTSPSKTRTIIEKECSILI